VKRRSKKSVNRVALRAWCITQQQNKPHLASQVPERRRAPKAGWAFTKMDGGL
jgi:hypothetical protein